MKLDGGGERNGDVVEGGCVESDITLMGVAESVDIGPFSASPFSSVEAMRLLESIHGQSPPTA